MRGSGLIAVFLCGVGLLSPGLGLAKSGKPKLQPATEEVAPPPPAPPPPPPIQVMPQPSIVLPPDAVSVGLAQEPPPRPLLGPPYRKLFFAGLGVVGGTYFVSTLLGAISYGAFVEGQWGWFVPIAGPIVEMAGACDNVSACYFKIVYTYVAGTLTLAAYAAGITLAIVGAVGDRRAMRVANRFQILPYASAESTGLVVLGRF